jgi:hypothetical protein
VGRHSSPSQLSFYRSVVGWFLPWALLGIVVGVVAWAGIDMLGGDEMDPPVATAARSPSPSVTPEASPTESPSQVEVAEETPEPKAEEEPKVKPKLITKDVTVQVLNATSNSSDADDVMADKLAKLGYDIVAVGDANRVYQETTVMWSFEETHPVAKRLAERFGWAAGPKPANLSTTVDIHVVVGEDFEG